MNIEFIDLTEVQKDVVHCYAHRTGNEKKSMEQRQKETLIEHTVAQLDHLLFSYDRND